MLREKHGFTRGRRCLETQFIHDFELTAGCGTRITVGIGKMCRYFPQMTGNDTTALIGLFPYLFRAESFQSKMVDTMSANIDQRMLVEIPDLIPVHRTGTT